MKYIILASSFFISTFLFAQDPGNEPRYVDKNSNDPQFSQNIVSEEKKLDAIIKEEYDLMRAHSRLLVMKIHILPKNTVLYKGKMKGDDCIEESNQEDPTNNCVKLEIFDFVNKTVPVGPKNKFMVVSYDAAEGNESNPRTAPPRKLNKVKSKILVDNLLDMDRVLVEVVDEDPLAAGDHNDKITFATQKDFLPENYNAERPADYAFGKYKLSDVENIKSNPIRNTFKRESYIKHLKYFNEIYTKIFEFNDGYNRKKVKENNQMIKDALQY
jgi:hypothetical protein